MSWLRRKKPTVVEPVIEEQLDDVEPAVHPAHVRIGMAAVLNQEMYGRASYVGRHRRDVVDG